MNEASLEFNLGSIGWARGQLAFSFIVHNNGNAHLQIWASDPSDMRKAGVLLQVGEYGYRTLKQLTTKTNETIASLTAAGQLREMAVSFSTDVSLRIKLGSVESYTGTLSFVFAVHNDGTGHLQLYAGDPNNLRKSGVVVLCDNLEFESLKKSIQKADELIARLSASEQVKQLVVAS